MQFKNILNKKTNKTSFYVNNKKVSENTYNYNYNLCNILRLNYNSSITKITGCYIKQYFSFN